MSLPPRQRHARPPGPGPAFDPAARSLLLAALLMLALPIRARGDGEATDGAPPPVAAPSGDEEPLAPPPPPPAGPEANATLFGLILPRGDGGGGGGSIGFHHPIDPRGRLSLGGTFGAAILASDEAQIERSFAFLAASARLRFPVGASGSGFELRARAGGQLGALQDEGIVGGLFLSGGAWWSFPLGGRVFLGAGLDVWGVLLGPAGDDLVVYAPGVTVSFGLPTFDPSPDGFR